MRKALGSSAAVALLLQIPAACADPMTEKISNLFATFDQPGCPGASAMVVQDGKVLFAKAFGLADVEQHIPCTTNTNFRLASVSKQFTAMAVMMLVDRNRLTLD